MLLPLLDALAIHVHVVVATKRDDVISDGSVCLQCSLHWPTVWCWLHLPVESSARRQVSVDGSKRLKNNFTELCLSLLMSYCVRYCHCDVMPLSSGSRPRCWSRPTSRRWSELRGAGVAVAGEAAAGAAAASAEVIGRNWASHQTPATATTKTRPAFYVTSGKDVTMASLTL